MLAALLALAGSGPGPVKPIVVPAPVHYRIDAKLRQDVDLTAVGQPPMSSDLTANIFLSLTMSDTTGGKLAHVIIDSMRLAATGQLQQAYPQSVADSAEGTFMNAYIVGGRVQGNPTLRGMKDNAAQDVENSATSLARQTLSLLFAGTRSGKQVGEGWTDTTESSNTSPSGTQKTKVIHDWKVTGVEGGVITIEGSGNSTLSLDGGQQTYIGTATSKTTVTSPAGGPSTHATMHSNQALQVTAPGLPEPIPVTAVSDLTLTILH